MRCLTYMVGLLAALALRPACADPPPVEAFGRTPQIADAGISPDGKWLALAVNAGPQPAVNVLDLATGKRRAQFPIDVGTKLRSVRWTDDETLLLGLSITESITTNRSRTYEKFRYLAVDVESGNSRVLLEEKMAGYVTGMTLLALHGPRPHSVVLGRLAYSNGWSYTLYSVDTRSGQADRLEKGTDDTVDWVVDPAGVPLARGEWIERQGSKNLRQYTVSVRVDGEWRPVFTRQDVDPLDLIGVSADGSTILAIGANGAEAEALWAIPTDGSAARTIVAPPLQDVSGVIFDPYDLTPVAVGLGGLTQQKHWLDARAEARGKVLQKAFPKLQVELVSRSANAQRVVARVGGPSSVPIYYLVDFATKRADIIGEAYPALAAVKLGEVRAMTYAARDGTAIPAYVTVPPEPQEAKPALVVLPHGGPESRDDYAFDWWSQFLASRGYVVLQPQFRGSTGFGEAFRKAGYREWGGLMQDDVTDGVKAMVDQGLVDPARVCIVGASYGGYAALAGAAFTPELYRCAASIGGVTDLRGMIAHADHYGDSYYENEYWRRHIGEKYDPQVLKKSPAREAASIKAAVLLIHGMDDTVVPIDQAERMNKALKDLNRRVKFVRLEGEDHWLTNSETRLRMLVELEAFLASHLAPLAAGKRSPNPE